MLASPIALKKLTHLRAELVRDFPEIPAEHVDELVDDVSGDLLEEARFDDFVPLLAHRRLRERLARESAAVA